MKEFIKRNLDTGLVYSTGLALVLCLMIESFGRQSLGNGLYFILNSPKVFFYNTFLIFMTLILSILIKRRFFFYTLASLFWLSLGITNGIVLSFRMTPFTVSDFALLENGLSILPNYLSKWQIALISLGFFSIIALLVAAYIFAPRLKGTPHYAANVIVIIVISLLFAVVTDRGLEKGWLSNYFGNLAYAYKDYGTPYCFLNTWLIKGISTPEHYSSYMVRRIFEDGLPADIQEADQRIQRLGDATEIGRKRPNIVFVQLESFIDPTLIKGVSFSTDPAPNFRRLKQSDGTGFLRVPSVGAGTANTEFEILTGMRIRAFGPGEYPYKTVLKDRSCESMCFILKDLGYTSHAIHNHKGTFYGRNLVFPNLGFDTFTSVEYMNRVKKTPNNWAKDKILVDEIKTALDSTEGRDFVFAISVQGHGKYPEDNDHHEELHVRITEGIEDEKYLNAMEYYVNQVYEMDQFVGDLVEELKHYEETVIVFYGDHIPVLDLTEQDLANGSVYETQYLVVSNFEFPRLEGDLTSYQLSAKLFELLGIHKGILTWYHQTRDGYSDYLKNLDALQYDMLYGKNYIYGGKRPYNPTEMKMGIREIVVDRIFDFGDSTYVVGENFTPYSKLKLNGKLLDTIFVNPNILKIPKLVKNKDDGDFAISQVGEYNTVLSTLEDVE